MTTGVKHEVDNNVAKCNKNSILWQFFCRKFPEHWSIPRHFPDSCQLPNRSRLHKWSSCQQRSKLTTISLQKPPTRLGFSLSC